MANMHAHAHTIVPFRHEQRVLALCMFPINNSSPFFTLPSVGGQREWDDVLKGSVMHSAGLFSFLVSLPFSSVSGIEVPDDFRFDPPPLSALSPMKLSRNLSILMSVWSPELGCESDAAFFDAGISFHSSFGSRYIIQTCAFACDVCKYTYTASL